MVYLQVVKRWFGREVVEVEIEIALAQGCNKLSSLVVVY